MGRLEGKVAIVTGAGSGFGEAIAHGFVTEGACVLVADIAVANGQRVVDEITKKQYPGGGSAVFVELNVAKRGDWEKGLALAQSTFGQLDIVVNNAGTTYKKKPSVEVSDADFDQLIAVNVKSIYLSVSVVMPYFVKRKAGVFLNTSSVAGERVRPGQVFYGGSKGFLNTVSKHSLLLPWSRLTPSRSQKALPPSTAPAASASTRSARCAVRQASSRCSAAFRTRPKSGPGLL